MPLYKYSFQGKKFSLNRDHPLTESEARHIADQMARPLSADSPPEKPGSLADFGISNPEQNVDYTKVPEAARKMGAAGLRTGLPIAAGVVGSIVGGPALGVAAGAATAGLGEAAAERLERREYAPKEIAAAGVLGAVAPGVTSLPRAAAFGYVSSTLDSLARGEGIPSVGDSALSIVTAMVLHKGIDALTGRRAISEVVGDRGAADVASAAINPKSKPPVSGSRSIREGVEELQKTVRAQQSLPLPKVELPGRSPHEARVESMLDLPDTAPAYTPRVKGKYVKPTSTYKQQNLPGFPKPKIKVTAREMQSGGGVIETAAEPVKPVRPNYRAMAVRGTSRANRYIAPPKFWFDQVQRQTGLPAFDDVYVRGQQVKQAQRTAMRPFDDELRTGGTGRQTLKRELDPKGLDVDKLMDEYIPAIKNAGGVNEAFPVEKPAEVRYFSRLFTDEFIGRGSDDELRMSLSLAREHTNKQHFEPFRKDVKNAYIDKPIPAHIKKPIISYMEQLDGHRDLLGDDMAAFFNHVFRKIPGLRGVDARRFAEQTLSLQYLGTIALRPGPMIRNMQQTFQTGYMFLGERYYAKGLTKALSPGARSYGIKMGFLKEEGSIAAEIAELGQPGGKISRGMRWVTEKALGGYRHIDERNRIGIAHGQYEKTLNAAIRAKGDVSKFVDLADLDGGGFVPTEAIRIARLYSDGRAHEAARQAGIALADNTQFLYGAGERSPLLSGTAGRTFGAFGNWSSWYSQILGSVVNPPVSGPSGSFHNAAKRGLLFGRFIVSNSLLAATSAAIGYKAHHPHPIAGALANTFIGPVIYQGAPALEATETGLAISRQLSTGQVKGVGKAALRAGRPFLPGVQQKRDLMRSIKTFQDRGFEEGMAESSGLNPQPPPPVR